MIFLFTYLHFLGFVLLVSLLMAELVMLCIPVTEALLKLLKKTDLLYGVAAGLVLGTGIARIFYEKGWEYYSHSSFFWVKVTLFALAGILSAYPTVRLIKAKTSGDLDITMQKRLKSAIIIQLLLIPVIISCAILMARGFQ